MSDQYGEIRSLPLLAVLSTLGFTEWKTRKNGREWYGRCPVHKSVKNNTAFSFDAEGKYFCFSCGSKGKGAIDLCMQVKQVGFREAVEALKGIDASAIQAPVIPAEEQPTENTVFQSTYEKFAVESSWLKERGFTPETLKHFGVFEYDNPKRQSVYKGKILIPIRRFKDGELVAYLARTKSPAEGEPKYLFAKGFLKHLEVFGSVQLKNEGQARHRRLIYLVESPFCVLKFWQHGLPAVSCFGWSVSPEQVDILSQLAKGVVFLPDRDKYGSLGQPVAALSKRLWVKSPELPPGVNDPEHLDADSIRALT